MSAVRIESGVLACPRCGEWFTHHGAVTIQHRQNEDGPASFIRIKDGEIRILGHQPQTGADWSSRRGAVQIEFSCEVCEGDNVGFVLSLLQHKGNTIIETTSVLVNP